MEVDFSHRVVCKECGNRSADYYINGRCPPCLKRDRHLETMESKTPEELVEEKISALDKMIELTEAVNNSKNEVEHNWNMAVRHGFLKGVEASGGNSGRLIIECDLHYINQGIDRPMCGGEFLDWEPAKD
jgi:predicted ATP-dependent serine protease